MSSRGTLQKALVLPSKHGEWTVTELPIPDPGPKDVLVKILATALNPVDWKVQVYGFPVTDYPHVGGTDGAGIVEAVGQEVTTFVKGDRVLFQGYFENPKATFQQYAIVPAEIAAKIPDNISFDQAASVPLGLATAVVGFYNHRAPESRSVKLTAPWEEGGTTKYAGQPIFIIGGASSVGQYAIQMAKLSGFSPIITSASPRNEQLLLSLGATHVLDRSLSTQAIQSELAKITQGKPIDLVFDTISVDDTQLLGYDVLAPGGNLLLVLNETIPAEKKKEGDNKKVSMMLANVHIPECREIGIQLYSRLTEWLDKGIVVPNKAEVLPNGLAGIPEGLERLKNNKVSATKLVARPQETP
ncbi:GroES-like protein [Pilatotrama ljubarskyi]|nr:GroES-like protein [Pilatotrama ljubarskyi]